MRRINGVTAVLFGALLFSSCSDLSETLVPDVPDGGDSNASGPLADINDGTTDGRPYFFFLNPFLQSKLKPSDVGVFDPTLEPTVTICPIASWDSAAETCSSDPEVNDAGALTGFPAVYPFDPTGTGDGVQLVLSAEKYQVVYKSGNYAMVPGRTYRVAVFIFGQALGWADMAVYAQASTAPTWALVISSTTRSWARSCFSTERRTRTSPSGSTTVLWRRSSATPTASRTAT